MSENLLAGYQTAPSFALWDGEHAVLRFTGKLDPEFKKTDSNGTEHTYLGIEVFLLEHSNEAFANQLNSNTIFRVGKESTIGKWVTDAHNVWAPKPKTVFKVFMSKKLGYDLRIENTEQ